jgi:hypothetical protein
LNLTYHAPAFYNFLEYQTGKTSVCQPVTH